jgi:hypothetical protein
MVYQQRNLTGHDELTKNQQQYQTPVSSNARRRGYSSPGSNGVTVQIIRDDWCSR